MRSLRVSIVLAAVVAAIPAAPLWGQAAESTAFHARQWGMDFDIGNGFFGGGVIHFSSPTRALVLSLSGSAATSTATGSAFGGNRSQLNLSLGARRYHPFAPRLYGYRTFGIEGSYQHAFTGGAVGSTTNEWMGGVFGEFGAGWMVTPHLALGGAWRFSADYGHFTETGGLTTGTSNGFSISLGQVRLTGQLYF